MVDPEAHQGENLAAEGRKKDIPPRVQQDQTELLGVELLYRQIQREFHVPINFYYNCVGQTHFISKARVFSYRNLQTLWS